MKGTLILKLGDKTLELSGEGDGRALIKNFSFWSNLPTKCGHCGKTNISLNYKSPKGNDYYGLRCLDCSAELNFGQFKQGGGFFLKSDSKWEVWKPKERGHERDDGPPPYEGPEMDGDSF